MATKRKPQVFEETVELAVKVKGKAADRGQEAPAMIVGPGYIMVVGEAKEPEPPPAAYQTPSPTADEPQSEPEPEVEGT